MKHTRDGDKVTIEMSVDDWDNLLLLMGMAMGSIHRAGNAELFYRYVKFINRLNTGNPHFTPYEVPPEFQEDGGEAVQ